MYIADLLIHVNENLSPAKRASLEEELRKISGVIAPRFNEETPHLLLVCYDAREVNSRDLLTRVKANAYNAQLVGM